MMQFSHILFGAALLGLGSQPGFAAGEAVQFSVTNTGAEALECAASIAHWFSEELGEIAPGATLEFSFGYDLPSGTIFRLNERDDEMAVQRIWCGNSGAAWETRAELPMQREAGAAAGAVVLNCAAAAGKTRCEAP